MEHRGFFERAGPYALASVAEAVQAKPAEGSDPHAGMDMGDAKKTGTGCCSCCGGMGGSMDGGKSGGMCGKQASINPDGSNDPLLNDPMWDKPSAKPAPKNQTPMP